MAQDPSRPKDDGKIRLPKVDAAMNKVAPTSLGGDRGGKDEKKPNRDEVQKKADKLATARKRFDRVASAEAANRKDALDDLKFKVGKQWPADIEAQRNTDRRPCLTINKIPTFVHQITNDLRQNRPAINVSPVGDRGDIEVAKMYRGLIRAIERDSAADIAYDTAVDGAASMGWGYVRLLTEYESADSFDQVIHVKRVRNPFSVYLDADHQEPDGADAKFGFITEMVPRDEFKQNHPGAQQMPWTNSGIGDSDKNWIDKDSVRVAEYFEVEEEPRTLVALSNGFVGWKDDLSADVNAIIAKGDLEIVKERESVERCVKWYKLTAVEILEEQETVWDEVPIIKFLGDETDIEGKVTLSGVIRHAKDPQRMYNYWSTSETEIVALAPKAPFIVAEGQIEGHEPEWKQANTKSLPYLQYNPTDIKGHPVPAPQRQPAVASPAGVVQAKMGAAQDMMATTGIRFDATKGERLIDESGVALKELRRTGDLGSFHYADNMARSLRRIGRLLIKAIPKVYDTKRVLTILREDDSEERVTIDPNAPKPYQEMRPAQTPHEPNPKVMKIFNPKYGEYGCTVTIGPSYATKRLESSESMIAFAKALPQTAGVIADLIAKEMDWPGADKIAARLAKTLPANLLTPEQKDIPPQVQALLQAMDGQIKKLTQELMQAMKALQDKGADRAIDMEKINKDFEAKMFKIVSEVETKMAAVQEKAVANYNTHIVAQIKQLGENVAMAIHAAEKPDKKSDE